MSAGQQVVAAMAVAGWTVVGGIPGAYARLQWRDERGLIVVPLDPAAPEHDEVLDAAIATLGLIADRGASAQRALDGLTAAGVIL